MLLSLSGFFWMIEQNYFDLGKPIIRALLGRLKRFLKNKLKKLLDETEE